MPPSSQNTFFAHSTPTMMAQSTSGSSSSLWAWPHGESWIRSWNGPSACTTWMATGTSVVRKCSRLCRSESMLRELMQTFVNSYHFYLVRVTRNTGPHPDEGHRSAIHTLKPENREKIDTDNVRTYRNPHTKSSGNSRMVFSKWEIHWSKRKMIRIYHISYCYFWSFIACLSFQTFSALFTF